MKNIVCLIVMMVCMNTLNAQSWQWGVRGGSGSNGNTNDAETVLDMTTDNAGNVYVVARFESSGGATITGLPNSVGGYGDKDMIVVSYNCQGQFRWKKVLGGAGNNGYNPTAIGADSLNNIYVMGTGGQPPAPYTLFHFDTDTIQPRNVVKTFFLIKYDTAGNFKWLRQPTPDSVPGIRQSSYMPRDMIVNSNGDVEILCHLSPGLLSGSNIVVDTPSAYILKYNKDGNITGLIKPDMNWRQVAGDGKNPTSLGNIRMAKTKSGKYVVSGRQNINPLSPGDPLVIGGQQVKGQNFIGMFDHQWKLDWKKHNDTILMNFSYRPVVDNSDNIYVAGISLHNETFYGYTVINNITIIGHSVPVLLKLNSAGTVIYGSNGSTNAASGGAAVATNQDKVYVTGRFPGKLVWDSFSVENPPNVGYDVFLASFNMETGVVIGLDSLKGNPGFNDNATALISDNRGNIYLGGEMGNNFTIGSSNLQSAGGNSDFFVAKYGTANCSGTVVPLKLVSFTASWQSKDVLTRWQTAQEQNTKAFVVERSANALHFDSIATVAARGNSSTLQSYSFTDVSLPHNSQLTTHNSLFYRLKMLDLDGSYTYSPIAKVSLSAIKGISVFPNPAKTSVVVSYALPNGAVNNVLEVYNMMGQRMNVGGDANIGNTNGSRLINTASLPAGIYQIILRSNGKVVGREKLVVEK